MPKGYFITLEGIEGCGKTTQIARLEHYFLSQGIPTLRTKEPGGTSIGTKIREILLSTKNKNMEPMTELFLYIADRRQHIHEIILPALQAGKIVLCDRYADATTAYQGAGRRISTEILKKIHKEFLENLTPHLTFLLDLPVKVAIERIKNRKLDRFETENAEFHSRVRQEYLKIAEAEKNRFTVIHATGTEEDIHEEIKRKAEQRCGLKS